jgi:hypothetical protein
MINFRLFRICPDDNFVVVGFGSCAPGALRVGPELSVPISFCHGLWRAGAGLIWHIANSLEMHDSP